MVKRFVRWILPVLALLLIATILMVTAVLSTTHAAAPRQPASSVATPTATPGMSPDTMWGW